MKINNICIYRENFFWKKLILLLIKEALNWSENYSKDIYNIIKDFYKCGSLNFLFIKESWKKVSWFTPKYDATQLFWMISEGSCDTEDWIIDAENSALHHRNKLHFKIYYNRKQLYYIKIISYSFTDFYQINVALMSKRDFFQDFFGVLTLKIHLMCCSMCVFSVYESCCSLKSPVFRGRGLLWGGRTICPGQSVYRSV